MGADVGRDVDAYAREYIQNLGFEVEMVRLRRLHVLASLRRHAHANVLEVGCGLEPLFAFYDDRETHTTIEPGEAFAANARALARTLHGVDVRNGTLERVAPTLVGRRFDFVVASSLLHEVPDTTAFLGALRSVCESDSVVHVNVPNAASFHRLLALEMGLIQSLFETSQLGASLQRSRELDEDRLRRLVEEAGFRVLRFETYAMKPFTHRQMETLLATDGFPPGLVDGLARMVKYAPSLGSEMSVELTRR